MANVCRYLCALNISSSKIMLQTKVASYHFSKFRQRHKLPTYIKTQNVFSFNHIFKLRFFSFQNYIHIQDTSVRIYILSYTYVIIIVCPNVYHLVCLLFLISVIMKKWKMEKKQLWIFVYIKYGKYWSISLDNWFYITHILNFWRVSGLKSLLLTYKTVDIWMPNFPHQFHFFHVVSGNVFVFFCPIKSKLLYTNPTSIIQCFFHLK